MARKALLIGASTGELRGIDNDIEAMTAGLGRWGFVSTACVEGQACRAGILDAYERLIADARPEDAIVVYYSGHGGYGRRRDRGPRRPDPALQFIVPTDFDESREGDFRGIMAAELSILLARLTDRTRNVTVILDCCHAAHMSRDDRLVVKAQPRPVSYQLLTQHLEGLRRGADGFSLWQAPSNPWAVRIVACAPDQSAYEYTNAAGMPTGLLTDALVDALASAHGEDLRVSWSTVIERVRERVLTYMPVQRPEAEGPAQRLLFDTADAEPVAGLPVRVSGGRVWIEGAALLGVRVGDEFAVVPPERNGVDGQAKIGDVVIDEVRGAAACGALTGTHPDAPVPMGARAYQTKATGPAMPVRLPEGGMQSALRAEIERSPTLRVATPDDPDPVQVRVDAEDRLAIWDRIGPLHQAHTADAAGLRLITEDLERLAWAHALRRLAGQHANVLDAAVDVEFGRVNDGEPEPLPTSGAVLYVGQRLYLRVRNNGERRLYVSLLDIGVSSRVTILNTASPAGEPVEPGGVYTFGWNDLRQVLQGTELSWPAGVAPTLPRPETVLVLVTAQPQDVRPLAQPGIRGINWLAPTTQPSLERLLPDTAYGRFRDLPAEQTNPYQYAVRTVDFDVVPVAPPVEEDPEFQVDDRPDPSVLLWSPKGAEPARVAVRLSDLVVHHNRAFRSADIRLDAMVLTRGPDQQPRFAAQTERFSNIRDGQTLPLDKMLIYHGRAVDYLDLAVWVSRDASGSLALADLMQEKLTLPDVQLVMGQLGSALIGAPQAAVAVAAIGASAVLINAAYHLLNGIVGTSIGLYRTTLLAGERYGIGRPIEERTVRAQDFSFTYLIEEVS